MDKALVFGTKDCRLESCQGQACCPTYVGSPSCGSTSYRMLVAGVIGAIEQQWHAASIAQLARGLRASLGTIIGVADLAREAASGGSARRIFSASVWAAQWIRHRPTELGTTGSSPAGVTLGGGAGMGYMD